MLREFIKEIYVTHSKVYHHTNKVDSLYYMLRVFFILSDNVQEVKEGRNTRGKETLQVKKKTII